MSRGKSKKPESKVRTDWASVVNPLCTACAGTGWRNKAHTSVCLCIWRGVFGACYGKFRQCAESLHPKAVMLDVNPGPTGGRQTFGIRSAEYMADFCLIAKRTLTPQEHVAFKMFFLYGADWTLCAPRVGMTRGLFFHLVYRIEAKVGKALATVQPYPLFPCDEYFGGCSKPVDARPLAVPDERYPNGIPVRPPLAAKWTAPTVKPLLLNWPLDSLDRAA